MHCVVRVWPKLIAGSVRVVNLFVSVLVSPCVWVTRESFVRNFFFFFSFDDDSNFVNSEWPLHHNSGWTMVRSSEYFTVN